MQDSASSGGARAAVRTKPRCAKLLQGWPVRRLDAAIRSSVRAAGMTNRELALLVGDLERRRVYQLLGFTSTLQYLCARCEMSRSKATRLLQVARALWELRKVDEAFVKGHIAWSRVHLLATIATVETEDAWLEAAKSSDWRTFERLVRTSERGLPPRHEGKGLRQPRLRIVTDVDVVTYEMWERAKAKLSAESREELTDQEAIRTLARLALATRPDGEVEGRQREGQSPVRVVVHDYPRSAVTKLQTEDGLVPLDPAAAAELKKDAEVVVLSEKDVTREAGNPAEGGLAPKTPEWLRDFVLARDGYRCRHCGASVDLHAHHIIWRSVGGPTTEENLLTVCNLTHALIHANLLRVEAMPDGSVRFQDSEGELVPGEPAPHLEGAGVDPPVRQSPAAESAAGQGEETDEGQLGEDWPELRARFVRFADIPTEPSPAWWRAHQHLFHWDHRRSLFRFTAGTGLSADSGDRGKTNGSGGTPAAWPVDWDDFIGQSRTVHAIRQAARSAEITGEPATHVLLSGESGFGKSSLAQLYARAIGSRAVALVAPLVADPGALLGHLTALAPRDVVVVDEIHALRPRIAEILYQAVENGTLSVTVADEFSTRALQIRLEPFTLVGATTVPDEVPTPLWMRFPLRETLEPYPVEDLVTILARATEGAGIGIDDDGAMLLGRAGRETPREVLALYRRVRDAAIVAGTGAIDRPLVQRVLREAGIDEDGLTAEHRRIVEVLRARGPDNPIGLVRLAAIVRMSVRTLRSLYEPFLMRRGLITATPRGRVALPQGGKSAEIARA